MKKVSIIVPVYNTGKYLQKCLDSIIKQNFINMEIIIINDCSTDNSLEIIKEYMKLDKRLILINKTKNEGLSAARNSGIEIAKGEYILHIDSDDWIEENYVTEVYEYAKKNNADIVILDYYEDYENESLYIKDQKKEKNLNKSEVLRDIFLSNASPAVWNKVIKTELYKRNEIYHPKGISIGEDLAVSPRLIYYSNKIIKLNKAYYHYIQNRSSLTKKKSENNKKIYDIYNVLLILEKFFKNKEYYIKEIKINYLSAWLLYSSHNLKEEMYQKIINEYIDLLAKSKIKNIFSLKVKILLIFTKIFGSERAKRILILLKYNISNKE